MKLKMTLCICFCTTLLFGQKLEGAPTSYNDPCSLPYGYLTSLKSTNELAFKKWVNDWITCNILSKKGTQFKLALMISNKTLYFPTATEINTMYPYLKDTKVDNIELFKTCDSKGGNNGIQNCAAKEKKADMILLHTDRLLHDDIPNLEVLKIEGGEDTKEIRLVFNAKEKMKVKYTVQKLNETTILKKYTKQLKKGKNEVVIPSDLMGRFITIYHKEGKIALFH